MSSAAFWDCFAGFLSRVSLAFPYVHACEEQALRDAMWWHAQSREALRSSGGYR